MILLLAPENLPIAVWMLYANFKEAPAEILEAARMGTIGIRPEQLRIEAGLWRGSCAR